MRGITTGRTAVPGLGFQVLRHRVLASLAAWLRTKTMLVSALTGIYCCVLILNVAALLASPKLSLELSAARPGGARISWLLPGGALWAAGVRQGDTILAIDGRPPTLRDNGAWSGGRVVVRTQNGTATVVGAEMVRKDRGSWPLLALSPWFLLLGTLIFLRAPQPAVGRATYALFTSAAFALALAPSAIDEMPLAVAAEYVMVTLFGASFLLFFLFFPMTRGLARLRALLFMPAIIVVALSVAAMHWSALYPAGSLLRLATLLFYLGSGVVLMLHSLVTTNDRSGRRGLAIIAGGTVAGILPFISLYVVPALLGRRPVMGAEQSIVGLAILPASFAYAIVRHNVLTVSLLQRWLVQGLLWTGLLIPYIAAAYVLHRLLQQLLPVNYVLGLEALLLLILALSFGALRQPLRQRLDRLIFKDTYDYRDSLHKLSEQLSFADDLNSLGRSLPATLRHLMNLDFAVLLVSDQKGAFATGADGNYQADMAPALVAATRTVRGVPETVHLAYGYLSVLLVPLRTHEGVVGHLCLGPKANGEPFRAEDRDLLATLSGHLGAIVRNGQLVNDLRTKVAALDTLNERLQHAQEEERAHLAAEIHDEPLQTAVQLQRQLAADGDHLATDTIALSGALLDQLRSVCTSMRPAVLDDLGLYAALDALALEQGERARVPVLLDIDSEIADTCLSADAELVLYRAAQEGINNSLRHARPSAIRIALRRKDDMVELSVIDDGKGFSVPGEFDSMVAEGHLGLAGLRKRVQRAAGRLIVTSAPGGGAVVRVLLPAPRTPS